MIFENFADTFFANFVNNCDLFAYIFRKSIVNLEIKFQLFSYIFRKSFVNLAYNFQNLINI